MSLTGDAVKKIILTTLSAVILTTVLAVIYSVVCAAFPALEPNVGFMRQYPLAMSLIIFALLPSIYEELIFRGLILGFLRKRMPDYGAVLISSLLFAVVHWGILQGFTAFVWGIYLSIVMIKTRSLFLCVYAHLLNNLAFLIL